jgi:hypothetical protein
MLFPTTGFAVAAAIIHISRSSHREWLEWQTKCAEYGHEWSELLVPAGEAVGDEAWQRECVEQYDIVLQVLAEACSGSMEP